MKQGKKQANKVKPVPPKHGQWKKGQSGNPEGGRKHDPVIKQFKALTKAELAEVGNLVVKSKLDDLKAVKDDPNASVLKVMLASIAVKVISKGDMHALDLLLNRLIGKVRDDVIVTGIPANQPQVVVTLPANGREAPE